MIISPILNNNIKRNQNVALSKSPFQAVKKTITADSFISFKKDYKEAKKPRLNRLFYFSKIFKNNNVNDYSYDKFVETANKTGLLTKEDLISNTNPKNLIGAGANSKVYQFSDERLDRWVLKEENHPLFKFYDSKLFIAEKDDFPERNLGQAIALSNDRYRILKKVNGIPHSIDDWSNRIDNGSIVTKKEALEFLSSLKRIQSFPQTSFDNYALDVKAITDKGYKQDSINPNNILIDYKKQKIQIIDFYKPSDPSQTNSKYDLINVLLDFMLFNRFFEKLGEKEQKEMLNCANNIINKCIIASKKAGLSQDEKTYINYLTDTDKWFGDFLSGHGGDCRTRYNLIKTILGQF